MQEQTSQFLRILPTAEPAFLRMLGLCARARKLAVGATLARDAVRGGKAVCAVLAADASENTKKRLADSTAYYNISLYLLQASQAALGHAIGKSGSVAALCVTDASFALALQKIYQKYSVCTDDSSEV